MKNIVKSLVVGLFTVMTVSAQTGSVSGTRWGKGQDSINCVRSFSLFQSDFQQQNFSAAIVHWRKVWRDCPQASVNLAPRGIQMYQNFIARELDQNKKMALVDTLMMVYEKGMILRPQNKGNYLVNMAQDILKFADTPENKPKLLEILEETMSVEKEKTSAWTYANYMKIVMELNAAGTLTDEELLEDYTKVSDFISDAIKITNDEELAKARDMIDDSFSNSSAASCENLLKIYGEKYDDNKDNADFLRKLTRMLVRKECTDSELFEKASEQQYALNPSSASVYNMARLFLRKDNFEKALEYFENAIESESDPIDKASYNFQLGVIYLTKYHRYNDAKRYTVEAIKLRPDWGEPYQLLSSIYVNGPKVGEDDFEKQYVYWVAVDKLQRARSVDPDNAARYDQTIRTLIQHFPKKEEAFFRGIQEGATISVGGWINETTRARFN